MKGTKLLSLIMVLAVVMACFAGCSSSEATVATTESTVPGASEDYTLEASASATDEVISFTDSDSDGNVLTLVPIYDSDGSTVIAGYIQKVTSKSGEELDAKAYPLLNSVVSATVDNGKFVLTKDSDNALVAVESYADIDGNLIAIKDVNDINQNKNKDEYLKLVSADDANGIKVYMLYSDGTGYVVVDVSTADNGTTVLTEGDSKQTVQKVDSSNTNVKNIINQDVSGNTQAKNKAKEKEKDKTTTKKSSGKSDKTTTKKSSDSDEDKKDDAISIVLSKNGGASCSSPNVSIATNEVNIEKGGNYVITSTTKDWHGQIIIKLKNTEKAEIRFEDVTISNTTKNIIQIIDSSINSDRSFLEAETSSGTDADDAIEEISDQDKAPNVSLVFPNGTSSLFTTSGNSYTGVIYNESKLTIKGKGSVDIKATKNANNAICSTKSITVKNVALALTTAGNNSDDGIGDGAGSAKGIFSYGKVNVESGSLTINSNGDAIRCDSFYGKGGTVTLTSSACDGIDADDAIVISDGVVRVTALEKYSFKVRRVNNQEKLDAGSTTVKSTSGIRTSADTFRIDGGTVTGESKKITTVQKESKQASVTCKATKANAGTAEASNESKVPVKFNVVGVKESTNKCLKFLYSSASVKKGSAYKIKADDYTTTMNSTNWNGNVGIVSIVSSENK